MSEKVSVPKEFWIKARGLQEGREFNILECDHWVETLVQQVYPSPENSAAVKMGPWVHVIEKSAYDKAIAERDKYREKAVVLTVALTNIERILKEEREG